MGWFWLDVPLLAVLFTMWAAACRWPGRPSREALDASDHVVYWIAVGLYLAIAVRPSSLGIPCTPRACC